MSENFPRVDASTVITVLEKINFFLSRQSGSHRIYKNLAGKRVTVAFHSGKILHPKILKSILKDADLTLQEFKDLI